mmetsp:Transcript_13103/g.36853  ORF Transcript_13103/g.36853 Transcript_13103/m.36853 type:complete len:316 (+) Transcript_13103:190-1137(+)|eukprot:CAMPEP_0172369272 /NCGR_PEP_ID=MMETSP1060-20121228/31880_1 /TAXON_ID=37318 /ORGANISM="Pseudo-nitzschia pungens, Strain cf. cingulata" /LENGTH=315 /DNA_ID=CAMNT_0013094141 /DNA_START=181 /DNA_END=1128 /DNA_ORIENTATION=-
MKHTATFLLLSAILLSQEAHSFSASSSSLFRQGTPSATTHHHHDDIHLKFPTTAERRRNAFSSIQSKASSTKSNTRLSMAPGAGAVAGVLTGGVLGGALHAIAGPDHLAALLPRCIGQRWYKAGRIGILWGMGHGVSVTILGVLGYALKSQLQRAPGAKAVLTGVSHLMEFAVGLSLVVIGVMGLKEAREWGEEMESLPAHSLSAAVSPTEANNQGNNRNRAVIFNGLLHGFSWDGAPSLAPALAVATWGSNLAFLSAYAAGTVAVMAIATSFIGEGTRRAGEIFNRPDLPQKLSFFTSLLAIAIGGIWCGLAIM